MFFFTIITFTHFYFPRLRFCATYLFNNVLREKKQILENLKKKFDEGGIKLELFKGDFTDDDSCDHDDSEESSN
jgi:hypothetical protein